MMNNFKDNSSQAIKAIRAAAYKGMTIAVELVDDQAVLNTTVDTGALSQSIDNIVEGSGTDTITGYVGTNSEYAIFVEKGTGEFATNGAGEKTPWTYQRANGEWVTTTGQKAKPYLEPAFKDNVKNIEKLIKAEFKGMRF